MMHPLKTYFGFSCLLGAAAHGFSLYPANPPRYATSDISLRVMAQDCKQAGFTQAELKSFITKAIQRYWNRVSTSGLKMHVGDDLPLSAVPPGAGLDEMAQAVQANEIAIGCLNDTSFFESGAILAVGGIVPQGEARGALALNDTPASLLKSLDEDTKLSVFAHELGHALGLGHSNVPYSLMYYAVSDDIKQRHLTEDDADGLTYLYPVKPKLGGFLGACGQLTPFQKEDDQPPSPPVATGIFSLLLLGLGLILLGRNAQAPSGLRITD